MLLARLRAVVAAKDAENAMLRAELNAALERYRRLKLRVAELERRLGQDSTNSGTPPSKEPIGAKERRKAGRRQRQEAKRERRQDRKRGGQPGTGVPACPGTRTRRSVRARIRRPSARGARPGWRTPSRPAGRGRRSGT